VLDFEKHIGKWTVDLEFFYQGGRNPANRQVSAYLANFSTTRRINDLAIRLGYDLLSGTGLDDSKDRSFIPLYGLNHRFYGFMDYFYVGNFHGQAKTPSGLHNPFVNFDWFFLESCQFKIEGHAFLSPVDLYDLEDRTNRIDPYLGAEIDLALIYKPTPDIECFIGYSHMFASSSMEQVKATPGDHKALNNWAWLMINIKPIFLHKKFGD
jgi:hypothetical protein